MDLLGYYKSNTCVCVWDLNSEEHPMIASWTDIDVDKICLSSTAMRIGIMSFQQNTISVFEIPSKVLIFEARLQGNVCAGFPTDFISNSACDKAAVVTSLGIFVQDLASSASLYEFSKGACSLLFSHDDRFVYVRYNGTKVVQCDSVTGVVLRVYQETLDPNRCCYRLIQNCSGSRVVWLVLTDRPAWAGPLDGTIITLDTSSGDICSRIPLNVDGMYCFRDEEIVCVGRSSGPSVSGPVSILNMASKEVTPTNLSKSGILGAGICNDIPTLFDMDASTKYFSATDLSNGELLFSIPIPVFQRRDSRVYFGNGAVVSTAMAGYVVLM
jgi:hypothetical protein